MNKKSIIVIFFFVCCIAISLSLSLENEQKEFDEALNKFYENSLPVKFLKKKRGNRGLIMRSSSEKAKNLHDIFTFTNDFSEKKLRKRRDASLSNPHTLSTGPGYTVNASYCPFSQNIFCDSSYKYRSYDGTCNNLQNPLLGSIDTPYIRLLSPAYQDGINSPRSLSVTGSALPNSRTISLIISKPVVLQRLTTGLNHLFVFFGQFLTHDLGGTSTTVDNSGNQINCPCDSTSSDCISIEVPANDPYLGLVCTNVQNASSDAGNVTCVPGVSKVTCISMTRSSSSPPNFDCSTPYRETLNLISSYIDGTTIYGMNQNISQQLRAFNGGMLLTSQGSTGPSRIRGDTLTNRTYLPLSSSYCSSNWTNPTYKCFQGGDFRTSENLALVGVQTLFLREHNRIATQLAALNPTWTDEIIYQETRRIVIAELQHITFNEYVPAIAGDNSLSPLETTAYYTGYNSNTNPQLTNEFTTAAFRMGHSLVRQVSSRRNLHQNQSFPSYFLSDSFFQSDMAYDSSNQGLNSIFVSLLNDLSWKFGTFGNQLQNNLFQTNYTNGSVIAQDLLAINVQRGRDHGLPSYVQYLKLTQNITINSFNDLKSLMPQVNVGQLKNVYSDVNDIDLYAGGLAETIVGNELFAVGPTFGAIIMEQFNRIKQSDRFYYENGPSASPYPFTLNQLAQIKTVTMAGLICKNFDIFTIQKFAFWISNSTNPIVDCSSLSSELDLSSWLNSV